MTKILLNTGPSERGIHRLARLQDAIDTIVLTGAYSRCAVRRAVHDAFRKLDRDAPPANACRIPLTQGKWAIVDADVFDFLAQWNWAAGELRGRRWIAVRKEKGRPVIQMHRVLCRTGRKRRLVDHVNGDGLDNRDKNLRPANHSQNGANARGRNGVSGFKGVTFDRTPRRVKRWQAQIKVNYKHFHLGRYATPEEAARAYDKAARAAWGKFARCNFAEGK